MILRGKAESTVTYIFSYIYKEWIKFFTYLVCVINNFSIIRYGNVGAVLLRYQIWPCNKIGHGQPRVIIWTNYDGLESPMLHVKFGGNLSSCSREEDF